MGDIATCGSCKVPAQIDCAACPFNCDLDPFCHDQGCTEDKSSCKCVMDRERDICNGVCSTAAEWIALQEAKLRQPESGKIILESNPSQRGWVARMFGLGDNENPWSSR